MTSPGEGTPPGSFWGRYVPGVLALVVLGAPLAVLPLVNSAVLVGVPAGLLAMAGRRPEGAAERYLPPLTAAGLVGLVETSTGLFALVLVLTGILLDAMVRRGSHWQLSALVACLPTAAVLSMPLMVLDREELRDQLLGAMEPTFRTLSGMGFDEVALRDQYAGVFDTAIRLLPGAFLMAALGTAVLALALGLWWLHRQGLVEGVEIPSLTMWIFPDGLRWLTLAGVALAVAAVPLGWPIAVETVGLNILVAAVTVWSVQGLSIVWYGFVVRDTATGWRVVFLVLTLFTAWLGLLLLALLGFVERWIPFRSLMAEGTQAREEEED